ncbi:energy transducer TonB [Mucilaginibacter sp. CSA2-8R]|uniref:energy transducer TonB n=1 Tax=Mucilaginibacter sp. CSA2-8R TaxID=3141542 RepID=UPI00315C9F5F
MNTKLITIIATAAFALSAYSADAQTTPAKSPKVAEVTLSQTRDVYTSSVEVLPHFPGGVEGFTNFLKQNINNKKAEAPGRVNITFVVEKDGSLSDVHAIGRNTESKAAEEAIRVIKLSPKWEPGKQNGQPVRVQYTVPVVFK